MLMKLTTGVIFTNPLVQSQDVLKNGIDSTLLHHQNCAQLYQYNINWKLWPTFMLHELCCFQLSKENHNVNTVYFVATFSLFIA